MPPEDAREKAAVEDASLVRGAARGDEDAFGALVERYGPRVAAICYGVTGDAECSRDLAQEVFTEAFLSLRRLRSPGNFAPWLARVARLKSVSWVRHRVRHREERPRGRAEMLAASGASPRQDAERREVHDRVLAAVRGLPPAYREVIILRCLEDEAPKEICRLLGISLAAMDKRLSRAKAMLREVLAGLAEGAPGAVDEAAPAGSQAGPGGKRQPAGCPGASGDE